ncbi:ZIP family metal transporter [Bacillus sp. FJAT-42376]|uniref:ZIP family metal transporter n=1 Tax=Bacillus sp. FJAT-42376 TaxID=2014076 RepID=UPI000F4E572A|nr:ZIP family metal transporter [Bacillus sp. FJAT-42376]AZB44332.1 ZIP family metal transporter [Bacillus sp. FJAT-42376]
MGQAALWGAFAGSSILIGALLGLLQRIPARMVGWIMSFGTGVLIGAASFDLLEESLDGGGILGTAIGFLGGALLFTICEVMIARKGGHQRKRSKENPENHSGVSIFIGTIIDAVPESVIIGVSILQQGSVSVLMVIAVFISNFPEGLSSTTGLVKDGYSKKKILFMWFTVVLLATISSLLGYSLLQNASPAFTASIGAFAAGGIIAMVASTMMPEAYEEGGPIVGMITSLGVLCSMILSQL